MSDHQTITPCGAEEWRAWLRQHHDSEQAVWVVFYKKHTDRDAMSWSAAVEVALCFGWIDSTRRTLDDDRFVQYFTRRKPKSMWSRVNKESIHRLTAEGRMAPAGLASVAEAKRNGSWSFLDEVEALVIPPDLKQVFTARSDVKGYFHGLSKSRRKGLLTSLLLAKRPETRRKRIDAFIAQMPSSAKGEAN